MLTTFNICKNIFPESELIISTESQDNSYINKLIPGISILNSSVDLEVDWIVHGGGGVFFDFKESNAKHSLINYCIRKIGYLNYSRIYKIYKSFRGNKYLRTKARAGLGIGVGTYTSSSNRFFSDILALNGFNILLVRDNQSILNAGKYCVQSQIHKATDLAFMDNYWRPFQIKRQVESKSIGFILRDWPSSNYVSEFLSVAKRLRSMGYEIKFFSFDERADSEYISLASEIAPVFCWKPNEMSITDFLYKLEICQLVISSRAHGAIVSACLGIPTVCIEIEPKLAQVAAMLKNSSTLISAPFQTQEILETIGDKMNQISFLRKATYLDVARNKNEMHEALTLFQTFVQRFSI